MSQTAEEIIRLLGLTPHPEGGFYAETFRDAPEGGRGQSSAVYFLLRAGELSAWHRVADAAEVWHYYAGASLELKMSRGGGPLVVVLLGPNLAVGERPQHVIPAGWWQTARSLGDWTLVGCTVAPGFDFGVFELAPPGFQPD